MTKKIIEWVGGINELLVEFKSQESTFSLGLNEIRPPVLHTADIPEAVRKRSTMHATEFLYPISTSATSSIQVIARLLGMHGENRRASVTGATEFLYSGQMAGAVGSPYGWTARRYAIFLQVARLEIVSSSKMKSSKAES